MRVSPSTRHSRRRPAFSLALLAAGFSGLVAAGSIAQAGPEPALSLKVSPDRTAGAPTPYRLHIERTPKPDGFFFTESDSRNTPKGLEFNFAEGGVTLSGILRVADANKVLEIRAALETREPIRLELPDLSGLTALEGRKPIDLARPLAAGKHTVTIRGTFAVPSGPAVVLTIGESALLKLPDSYDVRQEPRDLALEESGSRTAAEGLEFDFRGGGVTYKGLLKVVAPKTLEIRTALDNKSPFRLEIRGMKDIQCVEDGKPRDLSQPIPAGHHTLTVRGTFAPVK